MSNNTQPRSLNDRSWDILAEAWQNKETDERAGHLRNGSLFALHDAQYHALINRYFSQKRRQPLHHVRHLSKGVAGLLIMITLLSSAAFALTSKKRIYFNNIVVEEHEEYTSLHFVEDPENYIDIPEDWQ